jgi:hypothetical protein
MNLQSYYDLFLEKGLIDIEKIIYLANDPIKKLNQNQLELIGVKKPGHIFKILTRIEFDANLINENLNFLINPNLFYSNLSENINNNINKYSNENLKLNLKISKQDFNCCGFNRENKANINSNFKENKQNKNIDLIEWLKFLNLTHLIKNFIHNGFDSIEYLLLQCFSIYFVDDNLLENYMHIYNKTERNKILDQLAKDVNIINKKVINKSLNLNINLNTIDFYSEYQKENMLENNKMEAGCNSGCNIF